MPLLFPVVSYYLIAAQKFFVLVHTNYNITMHHPCTDPCMAQLAHQEITQSNPTKPRNIGTTLYYCYSLNFCQSTKTGLSTSHTWNTKKIRCKCCWEEFLLYTLSEGCSSFSIHLPNHPLLIFFITVNGFCSVAM